MNSGRAWHGRFVLLRSRPGATSVVAKSCPDQPRALHTPFPWEEPIHDLLKCFRLVRFQVVHGMPVQSVAQKLEYLTCICMFNIKQNTPRKNDPIRTETQTLRGNTDLLHFIRTNVQMPTAVSRDKTETLHTCCIRFSPRTGVGGYFCFFCAQNIWSKVVQNCHKKERI